jgi:hypothetical protein
MTLYSVIHTRVFEKELAELWLIARNPRDVTNASNTIDRILQHDPDLKGELIGGNLRKIAEGPLWVYYIVEPEDRKAVLWSVRWARS